jgi:uncharacterized protein (DUF305 family)
MIPIRSLYAAALAPLCLAAAMLGGCSETAAPAKIADAVENDFWKQNDLAMNRMMAGMEVKPTGDVDTDFALMMIPHHQGAIDMAKAQLRFGKNERLLTLAREIITKQEQEIAIMRASIGPAAPAADQDAPAMDMSHAHHTM